MPRLILLLHRYLGIAVGVLMVMWCLSGVVMMYHRYPVLREGDRLAHLEPIAWNGCCKIPDTLPAAVQPTTARERFWNWLGAVPHWLYFTELRRHAGVWSQVVIYASLLGCFLAGLGTYLGVRQWAARPPGRWSPYVGFNLWHHIAGLVFGIFTLTWVLSGLLSMNPWGWLQGAGAHTEIARIQGAPKSSPKDLAAALQAQAAAHPSAVSLKAAPLNGRLYFIAGTARGERLRLDDGGAPAPLGSADLEVLAQALVRAEPPNTPAAPNTPELMTQ